MSINSTDNKFGLPKPDFQELPKKKGIWPLLVIVSIVVMLIAAKVGYNFYFKVVEKHTSETVSNRSNNNQGTDTSRSSPGTLPAEVGTNVNGAAHQSVCEAEAFKQNKKRNKIKKSISATQKQLAAKQNKPLIKPGTYQELKEPQGIYHLVVVSHLDKGSAMKVVHQLTKKNLGVCLILPRINKGERYYRVTIGHSKTRYEADGKLEQFKPTYNNIFILKY